MDNCHVISLTYYPKLVAFVWITFFIPGRLAYIYTAPENVAVQHGGSAVLNCSTNASFSVWNFQQVTSTPLNPLCGIQCISYTFPGLSYSCYSPNPTNNTQCNVVVNSASSASAGYYICSDTDHFTKSAMVTVLESGPFCSTSADNTTQVNSSTPVVLGCNASFTATPTLRPNLNWSSEQSYNPPPTSNNTYAYSSAIVTNPVPTIASDTCTLSFSAPPNQPNTNATNAPSYTATCATSVVYPLYCPMNIFISQSEKTLICSAQSNPPASYQWFGPTGSTVISNSSTVEANDAGNYVCVATNSAADCSSSSNFTIDSDIWWIWLIVGLVIIIGIPGILWILVTAWRPFANTDGPPVVYTGTDAAFWWLKMRYRGCGCWSFLRPANTRTNCACCCCCGIGSANGNIA